MKKKNFFTNINDLKLLNSSVYRNVSKFVNKIKYSGNNQAFLVIGIIM